MEISVMGAGRIGSVLAGLLAGADHRVNVAGSRGPEALQGLVEKLGPMARALDVEDAAREADLVVLMVPFGAVEGLVAPDALDGKVVVDATNAFPVRAAGDGLSSSERIAAMYPGARLVKSLNTMNYVALGEMAGRTGDARMAHYVAGDDEQAKAVVAELVGGLGFAVLDTGSLRAGGSLQEPGGPLYNVLLTEAEAVKTAESAGDRT